jgi:hypothetical protein
VRTRRAARGAVATGLVLAAAYGVWSLTPREPHTPVASAVRPTGAGGPDTRGGGEAPAIPPAPPPATTLSELAEAHAPGEPAHRAPAASPPVERRPAIESARPQVSVIAGSTAREPVASHTTARLETRSRPGDATAAATAEAADSDALRSSSARGNPAPVANVDVHIVAGYPFEVTGCGLRSPAATTHDVQVPAPCTLHLLAPAYRLDAFRTIEASSGRVELAAPQLAHVTLRTKYEWCTVILGKHAVGAPPVELDLVAGSYTATIQCPDRTYSTGTFSIEPGRSIRRLDDFIH